MGWYDYFVNQSDKDFLVSVNVADSFVDIKYNVLAGHNQLFSRYASGSSGWCLYSIAWGGQTWSVPDGGNRCQNWEFRFDANGNLAETNGYAGRPPGALQQKYPPYDNEFFTVAPAGSFDYAKQRVLARSLAGDEGAEWTKDLIESGKCFKDIFYAAAGERGMDKLVAAIRQGPAEWAYHALLVSPLTGEQRETLLEKVSEDSKWAFYALRDVENINGGSREKLMQKVAEDSKWTQYAESAIDGFGISKPGGSY